MLIGNESLMLKCLSMFENKVEYKLGLFFRVLKFLARNRTKKMKIAQNFFSVWSCEQEGKMC